VHAAPLDVHRHNVGLADPVPGVLALTLAPGDEDAAGRAAAVGCEVDHRWGVGPTWTLRCPLDLDPALAIAALQDAPGVADVAAAFPARLTDTRPDDLGSGWWQLPKVGAPAAWDVTIGDPSVVVAIIDTGVRADHEDLVDNLWANAAEICGDGVDQDGNGYVDDCAGWDVGDGDPDVSPLGLPATDPWGNTCAKIHGTFIAGLVGQTGDNGTGGVGVNWDVSLMPIKLVDDTDCGLTDLTIAEALDYATDNGAHVINASWAFSTYSTNVERAFSRAASAGVVSVIAAGNDNIDVDTNTMYPIWFGTPNTLTVAATNSNDRMAGFSNYGAAQVDLAAPGANVRSTGVASASQYENGYGTSYAAPMVAGAAALVWAAYPALTAAEVVSSIEDGVDPVAALDCAAQARCVATGGRLSLPGALSQAEAWATRVVLAPGPLVVADDGDGDGVAELTETAELRLTLDNEGHGLAEGVVATLALAADGVVLEADTVDFGDVPGDAVGVSAPGGAAFVLRVDEACAADIDIDAVLTLETADGQVWQEPRVVPVRCVVDEDADGSLYPYDCDDLEPSVHPDADETCNERDDDCDGETDEDAVDVQPWYADADGDGFGDAAAETWACSPPSGHTDDATDCDDADGAISPGADEVCNDVDDDCDGEADEGLDCSAPVSRAPTGAGEGKGGCAHAPLAPLLAGAGLVLTALARRRRR
jgi:subtilisin family serine protease